MAYSLRMDGFEAYKHYLALKSHFTSKTYDYFKYNGQALDNEQTNQYILDDGPNVIGNYHRVGAKHCKSQTHGIKNECGENCAAPDETPKLQQICYCITTDSTMWMQHG